MNNLRLILGGPGCGKTTRLLQIVEEEMAAGVDPGEIAFVTFTKAAAREAQERAGENFNLDPEEDLPWFRTLHSLAYKRLGITRDEVMDKRDWREFSELLGFPITGYYDSSEQIPSGTKGDMMLRIVDLSATTMVSLLEAWHSLGEAVNWHELKWFDDSYSQYKEDSSKIDFTDMLLHYIHSGEPLNVRVAVVDEAQDLTPAQWEAVKVAFRTAERVYIGGDDDQAIYRWAGADVEQFLRLSSTPEILPRSHRLPTRVHALSSRVAGRITHRYKKHFQSTGGAGEVVRHVEPEYVDLRDGTWLLLARNGYMLGRLEKMCRDQGVNYRTRSGPAINPDHIRAARLWEALRVGRIEGLSAEEVRVVFGSLDRPLPLLREHRQYIAADFGFSDLEWTEALTGISREDRDYYVSCLRRGESFAAAPRVRVETIHGVKGAEADHVMMMTDMSSRTFESYLNEPDHEHRVFYVGATRAKRSLHIIAPQSSRSYPV